MPPAAEPSARRAPARFGCQWFRGRLWFVAVLFSLGLFTSARLHPQPPGDRNAALCLWVAERFGVTVDPRAIHWGEIPRRAPVQDGAVWFLGRSGGQAADVYLAQVRRSPEGGLLDVLGVYNLSETPATDERLLAAGPRSVAWAAGDDTRVFQVNWLQFDRSPLSSNPSLNTWARWQWRLAWWQRYGTLAGPRLRTFKLVPPAAQVQLAVDEVGLTVRYPDAETVIPVDGPPLRGGRYVSEAPHVLPRPGNLVTWAVDRARAAPWFGDENMQRTKAVAYRVADWLGRHGIRTPLDEESAHDATSHLDVSAPAPVPPPAAQGASSPAPAVDLSATPIANWPPPKLLTLVEPPLDREGEWQVLDGDPFIRHDSDGHVPFTTTFIRTDPERQDSRVTLTAWDPARVELHMMSGTEEPKSVTFETGSGEVPRTEDVLLRYVAGFNGGFQSTHGEFGMVVNRTVYVPPRAYAATFAELDDGSVGYGTWPESSDIPSNFISLRQNLTPLVAAGKYNPYHREWWGGVPVGWEDDTRTTRSGLCVTKREHFIYFYGSKVDPTTLARAMQSAECTFGMHLDMNQGHTGMEFYQVAAAAELPPLGLRLDGVWQAEGDVDGAPGYRFRGRRLFRAMQLMNFPRYIQRETRDFFYLTLRRRLPNRALQLANASADEGVWRALPEAGQPPVVASTSLRPDPEQAESRVQLFELDVERLAPTASNASPALVAWLPSPPTGDTIWWHNHRISLNQTAPEAVALFSGSLQPSAAPVAAAGIHAVRGTLLVAHLVTGDATRAAPVLQRALAAAGAASTVYLPTSPNLVVLGTDVWGHPTSIPENGHKLFKVQRSPVSAIFPETPVVPPWVWQPLQRKTRHEP